MIHNRPLIFLHIPKTAGTTLRAIVNRQYPGNSILWGSGFELRELLRTLPEHRKRAIRVLQGHMPFGLHAYLPDPAQYITMLRDPIDRTISTYYFIKRRPRNRLHKQVVDMNMSLRDFVRSGVAPRASNQQTRAISGLRDTDVSIRDLDLAKRNLAMYFCAVGITEQFDESIVMFKRVLGWHDIQYTRRNVTKDRPCTSELPHSTLKLIEKHNIFDMELYEFAKKKFDDVLREQDSMFWNEVCNLRRLN
jgi:Sulfotransferase family